MQEMDFLNYILFIFINLITFRKQYFPFYSYQTINGQLFLLHINNIIFSLKIQEVFREYSKINSQKNNSFPL